MTRPARPCRAIALHHQLDRVWRNDPGWRGVLSSVNHGDIGKRFMMTACVFFAIAGILAMLIRAQLATPDGAFLDVALYNQIFTMHGSIMMFLFAIPLLEGLALYLLPKILGARDMAFPRLSALGYWCYLFGGTILIIALLAGVAPDGGWFMYVPLTDKVHTPGISADVWLLGITFVEISAICAAVEITVSILRMRAAGMALTRMPLLGWYLLGTSAMMLVGFPPLILGSILLEVERAFGWAFFDPARGGDPLLWQHLFWLFGHPEVYIIFLPAAGAISTILPVMARTRILGYGTIVASIFGLVILSFGLWVHHMFTVGIPQLALAFFSFASALVALPTAVQIFAWIGTLWRGRPRMHLPMLYIAGFFATFVMGGLTGVMLAIVPFNWQAHDTAFVTAHLHYVLIGGFVFPMLGAAAYWMPLLSGRQRVRGLGEAAFWLIFLGFHGTFFIMHLTGLLGMPRRIVSYPDNPEWLLPNLVSSIGGFVMAIGFALFALDLALQAVFGRRTRRNPWQAPTLDWAMPLPPPSYNFAALPDQRGSAGAARRSGAAPDDAPDALALVRGEGLLAGAPRGTRETLVVATGSGAPEHVAILPGNSALPLWTALAIGGFFVLMLAGVYMLTPVAILLVVAMVWRWGRAMGSASDHPAITVAPGLALPVHHHVRDTLAHMGSRLTLVANGTLFASLLFGAAFLWLAAPNWPAPHPAPGSALTPLLALGTVLALGLAVPLARGGHGGAGLALNLLALTLLAGLIVTAPGTPGAHARDALRAALLAYVVVHGVIAALFAAFTLSQHRMGQIARTRRGAGPVWAMWQGYAAVTGALALGLATLPGWLA